MNVMMLTWDRYGYVIATVVGAVSGLLLAWLT